MSIYLAVAAAFASGSGTCVSSVEDGNTLRLCSGEYIKIMGIEVPPLHGADRAGVESREALKNLVAQGPVAIERLGKIADGATVANVVVETRDAAQYLVTWGYAKSSGHN